MSLINVNVCNNIIRALRDITHIQSTLYIFKFNDIPHFGYNRFHARLICALSPRFPIPPELVRKELELSCVMFEEGLESSSVTSSSRSSSRLRIFERCNTILSGIFTYTALKFIA